MFCLVFTKPLSNRLKKPPLLGFSCVSAMSATAFSSSCSSVPTTDSSSISTALSICTSASRSESAVEFSSVSSMDWVDSSDGASVHACAVKFSSWAVSTSTDGARFTACAPSSSDWVLSDWASWSSGTSVDACAINVSSVDGFLCAVSSKSAVVFLVVSCASGPSEICSCSCGATTSCGT